MKKVKKNRKKNDIVIHDEKDIEINSEDKEVDDDIFSFKEEMNNKSISNISFGNDFSNEKEANSLEETQKFENNSEEKKINESPPIENLELTTINYINYIRPNPPREIPALKKALKKIEEVKKKINEIKYIHLNEDQKILKKIISSDINRLKQKIQKKIEFNKKRKAIAKQKARKEKELREKIIKPLVYEFLSLLGF